MNHERPQDHLILTSVSIVLYHLFQRKKNQTDESIIYWITINHSFNIARASCR